jgi:hypothetical protein
MSAVRWLAGLAGALAVLVAGGVASEEVRARLDRLPFAVLRLARSRLPAELRERVHDQEWVPELEHILQHGRAVPAHPADHRFPLRSRAADPCRDRSG